MDILNIGGSEFLVLIFLALLLFGPEDLVKIARTLGRMTRKAQDAWLQVSSSLQSEVVPDEVRETLDGAKNSLSDLNADIMRSLSPHTSNPVDTAHSSDFHSDFEKPISATGIENSSIEPSSEQEH